MSRTQNLLRAAVTALCLGAAGLGTTSEALDKYDTRPPLDEMKRKSHTNPAYGFALRRMVEEDVSSEELLKMLDRLKKNRGAE